MVRVTRPGTSMLAANMIINLLPLHGTEIIKFGMKLSDVVDKMKCYTNDVRVIKRTLNHVHAFGSSLQIEFDETEIVQYIGVGFYPGCGAEYKIFGINPFAIESKELFKIISSYSKGIHEYDPREYLWEDIITTVWKADSQYDYSQDESRNVYGTVGVGNSVYLRAIRSIYNR